MAPAVERPDVLVACCYAAGEAAVWRDSNGDLWLSDDFAYDGAPREPITRSGEASIEIEQDRTRYVILGGVLPRAAVEVRVTDTDGTDQVAACGNGCWVVAFPDGCGLPLEPRYLDHQGNPL